MIATHQHELVPMQSLKAADYNPREMPDGEMEKLKRSLKEFGFVEPIVARKEDGLIVGGHQRLAAMQALVAEGGQDPSTVNVPVVWLEGVSDDKAKLLNLALNKIHGDWDYTKLNELLAGLSATDVDIGLSGFDAPEIGDILNLMGSTPVTPGEVEVDPDAELRRDARTFTFEVATDDEAALCRQVLASHGMTGSGNAAEAFVAAMKVAHGNNQAA